MDRLSFQMTIEWIDLWITSDWPRTYSPLHQPIIDAECHRMWCEIDGIPGGAVSLVEEE